MASYTASFFSSPEKADTPECIRVAKDRCHEFMGDYALNKKRRRSFIERSNSIIGQNNTTHLSDHNIDEILEELNKSKADLEKSEREKDKAKLARELAENTLKASRESASKVEELINQLQEDVKHERLEKMKESRKREESDNNYTDQMKKYQQNVDKIQENHKNEIESLDKHIEDFGARNAELQQEKSDLRGELIDSEKKFNELNKKYLEIEHEVAISRINEETAIEQLKEIPENLEELKFAKHECDMLQAKLLSFEQEQKMVEGSKKELQEASDVVMANKKLKRQLETMRFNQESYFLLVDSEKGLKVKVERLEKELERAERELCQVDVMKLRVEELDEEKCGLELQVGRLQGDVIELGSIRTAPAGEKTEDTDNFLELQKNYLNSEQKLAVATEETAMLKEEKKQMKKRLSLLEKEARSFHEIITSYESELTIGNITMKKLKMMDGLYKEHHERSQELEILSQDLREQKDRVTLEFVKIKTVLDKWRSFSAGNAGLGVNNVPTDENSGKTQNTVENFFNPTQNTIELINLITSDNVTTSTSDDMIKHLSDEKLLELTQSLEQARTAIIDSENVINEQKLVIAGLELAKENLENPAVAMEFVLENPLRQKQEEKQLRIKNLESDKSRLLVKVEKFEKAFLKLKEERKTLTAEKMELEAKNDELVKSNATLNSTLMEAQNTTVIDQNNDTTIQNATVTTTDLTLGLNTTDITVQANLLTENGELKKQLKEQLKASQQKIEKTKKTLLDKIKEMLWFVERVLGYKVKKNQNNYFLYSEFSEIEGDGFHFCMTKQGEKGDKLNFELQVNETYESLSDVLTEQLQRQKCLPSFCASWQLDLYSQMTTLN